MTFKDIKQNYPIYILNTNDLTFVQGKAVAVSFPRIDVNQKAGKTEMVIDMTIEAGDKTATYVIPENLSVTYAGNIVLAVDKQYLTGEVEALKAKAEQVVASVAKAQAVIDKAPALLAELNPAFKEKRETEQRFNKIESSISRMEEMMANFIKEFKS